MYTLYVTFMAHLIIITHTLNIVRLLVVVIVLSLITIRYVLQPSYCKNPLPSSPTFFTQGFIKHYCNIIFCLFSSRRRYFFSAWNQQFLLIIFLLLYIDIEQRLYITQQVIFTRDLSIFTNGILLCVITCSLCNNNNNNAVRLFISLLVCAHAYNVL